MQLVEAPVYSKEANFRWKCSNNIKSMILFHIVPARASLGEAQDHHGDGPGHAGEGDDDGAPGMKIDLFAHLYSIPFSLVSCTLYN